jgi:hypothetical protein
LKPINITTIDEIISALDDIIQEAERNNSTFGYFAVLYQKVTIKVKEGIENDFFEDNERMEKLDILFAKRYLDAYQAYQNKQPLTDSWRRTFELAEDGWLTVIQHLLLGMNAHINLDLGIAAAEIQRGHNIDDLQSDFNKINEILSSLVYDVQNTLAHVWPPLRWILKKTRKLDDLVVDFSMKIARDGAWKFAKSIALLADPDFQAAIPVRDQKVADKVEIITNPGFFAKMLLRIIRLGERGTVMEKIAKLKK